MHLNIEFKDLKKIVSSAGDILPADFLLSRISSLECATSRDVAVVIDRGDVTVFEALSLDKILKTKAACILASYDVLPGRTCVVEDPLTAYQALIDYIAARDEKAFFADERYPQAFISRDAHIDHSVVVEPGVVVMSGARVGVNTVLRSQAYVGIDAELGSNIVLHSHAKVLDRCVVGDYSILYSGSVIGADGFGYQVTSRGLRKIPQIGIVRVGKHVEIGANATIDRAAFDETCIDDGSKLDNLVSIAHNVYIGKGTAILPQTCIGGSTRVGAGCLIGAQVVIRDNIVIGDRVKIVSKSGIMNNIEEGVVVAGVPAVSFTDWKRIQVITRQLPAFAKQMQKVAQSKSLFRVVMKKIESFIKW